MFVDVFFVRKLSLYLTNTSDLSEFLPLITFLRYRHKIPFPVLGLFFLLSATIKAFTLISAEMAINNMPAFHLLAAVELVCIFLFYDQILHPPNSRKLWLVALLLLNLLYLLFRGDLYSFNSIAWSINMLIFILLGFAYYYQLYQQNESIPIERHPLFFINAAFLIYAAGSFFTYLFGWQILSGATTTSFFHNAWVFQSVANLIKNLILIYGLWLYKYT